MVDSRQQVRIFVASPSDVSREREGVRDIIKEFNRFHAPFHGVHVEFVGWETHAVPSAGRPQTVINNQIGEYDIFIGIMWKRFGTPTGIAGSGTEEEFRLAYRSWQSRRDLRIMMYFCQRPFMPRNREDVDQIGRVIDFRNGISDHILSWEYSGAEVFPNIARPHITKCILDLIESMKQEERPIARRHVARSVILAGSEHEEEKIARIGEYLNCLGLDVHGVLGRDGEEFEAISRIARFAEFAEASIVILPLESEARPAKARVRYRAAVFVLGFLQSKMGPERTVAVVPEEQIGIEDPPSCRYLEASSDDTTLICEGLRKQLERMSLFGSEVE